MEFPNLIKIDKMTKNAFTKIKFSNGQIIPVELHKVRMVQKLFLKPVEERLAAIEKQGFTLSQTMSMIDRVHWLYRNLELIGGLKFIEEPPVLRFFNGKLATTSD